MPLPKPNKEETETQFVRRFMNNKEMKKDFPDEKQRLAVAFDTWRNSKGGTEK